MLTVKFQHHVTHIAPFVVFYKTDHVVFLCSSDEASMVCEELRCRLGDQYMKAVFNSI